MVQTLIIVSKAGHPDLAVAKTLLQSIGFVSGSQLLKDQAMQFSGNSSHSQVSTILQPLKIDWCLHETLLRPADILVCDMDSTIIGQECIDEMADLAGVGEAVQAITKAAMHGDLEFSHSLSERVEQLAGQSKNILDECWNNRITINPGAKTLIATMNRLGAKTALVSGGFTWFAKRVAQAVGFSEYHANQLEFDGCKLTGNVIGEVIDGVAKLGHLSRLSKGGKITCVIGDGANDLAMVKGANIGIAYHAKPILEQSANGIIRHTDLSTTLLFQGVLPKNWVFIEE
ncbi:MAG: phosphoserine phosphatase SerB [Robiginitomaculum sp.]|nr:phosphoserine phosphatase SerB [Robiginitomaculum sp.]